jgi:type II secretory pathway component PulF
MADQAENREETAGSADDTAAAKKKPVAKKAPAKKAPAAKPVVKAEAPRKVALKKLDVKSLADELRPSAAPEAPAPAPRAAEPAPRPGVVKAVPVKPGSAKAPAGKENKRSLLGDFMGPAALAVTTGRVSERRVIDFLRQLIMLLRAGTPILRSLQTLSKRTSSAGTRALIADITQYVEAGNPLWQAFDRHNRYFDRVFVNLIKASEASGTLVTVLGRVVTYRSEQAMMRKRVRGAMIYPFVLVVACVGVMLLLTKFVIPEFKDIFEKANIETPAITQAIFKVSDFVGNYWWVPIPVLLLLFVGYKFGVSNSPLMRYYADSIKIRIPIVGSIIKKSALVELTRTLALLIRSGVPMMATLELTRSAITNRRIADCLQGVRDSIERGGGMEGPLRKSAPAIPHVMTDMIVTGEESGKVDEICEQIADIYEEEVEIETRSLGEALQPLFTVIVGIGVMILFVSLFLPLITSLDQIADSGV